MTDIAKCKGGECPLKDTCYRYLSKAGHYQTYFNAPPYQGNRCDHYWPVTTVGDVTEQDTLHDIDIQPSNN